LFLTIEKICIVFYLPNKLAEKCIETSVRISEGEMPPGRPRRRWENNIKISLLETVFELESYVSG
jgi:hypothetical protein